MYPGLTNTRVKLPKIVRSSCFMILGIHFITTRKIQEIAFQGFQISKFSRGSMPPDPPRWLAPSARDCPPQLQCAGAATGGTNRSLDRPTWASVVEAGETDAPLCMLKEALVWIANTSDDELSFNKKIRECLNEFKITRYVSIAKMRRLL